MACGSPLWILACHLLMLLLDWLISFVNINKHILQTNSPLPQHGHYKVLPACHGAAYGYRCSITIGLTKQHLYVSSQNRL